MALRPLGLTKQKWNAITIIKGGYFARECRAPRDNRNREPVRRNVTVEKKDAKALVAQDGLTYDWSDQAEEGPINFALMAYTSLGSSSSSSSDTEILKLDIMLRDNALTKLRKKIEKAEKERDDLKLTLEKFENLSKNLRKLLDSQYHVVPPPYTGNFMPPKPDLVLADKDEYVFSESVTNVHAVTTSKVKTSKSKPKSVSEPLIEDWISDSKTLQEAAVSVNTDRPINNAYPRPTVNYARPTSNVFNRAHSHVRRPFNKFTTNKNKNFNEKFNTVGPKVVVSDNKGNDANVVKASTCWVWRPKQKVLDHGNPQQDLKDKGVIDSGCSRHMIGNRSYLTDYEKIDGGFFAFGGSTKGGKITKKGKIRTSKLDFKEVYFIKELKFNLFSVLQMCDKQNSVLFTDTKCVVLSPDFKLTDESHVLLKVPRKENIYSVGLKNVAPSGGLTCLFAKATLDESNLWHRRLGHVNFKTINKLDKGNLVRGLPSKLFEISQTCVACQKGKQHRASCKTKTVSSISQPLQMLHMDLFGPTFVKSLLKKMYGLVVTDDFSIEKLKDLRVKVIRCDNRTEFKNRVMNQFCEMKGIKREFSVAWTPQQNRVAKRKNRTLIEVARTMLADSKLPTTLWAEAVNTACYVQNRVLVIKPHNKTPYELFLGRKPALGFKRPFGCPVTIVNTIDHLGKFDGKAVEGFFIGYSTNSRVFNSKTRIVEENLHVQFSKNTPNIAGTRPNWLLDIDALKKSMNYKPVVAGNQSNGSAGIKACDNAGKASVETVPGKDYILLPLWTQNPPFSSSSMDSLDAGFKPSGEEEKKDANVNNDDEDVSAEADMTNLDTHIPVSPIPTTIIHKDNPVEQIIRDIHSAPHTKRMTKSVADHGSGPDWLFDIDALTRTINYETIVAGTQSNGFAGTNASNIAGQARKETELVKDYILLPLWTADPPYSQDLKSSHDDGFKPSSDDGKKVDEDPRKESECKDQEKNDNVNNTNNVNTISSTVNAASTNEVNAVGGKTKIKLSFDPNMPTLEADSIFDFTRDDEDDSVVADMNNLDTTIKTQTRKMSKNLEEHGFVSTIQQRTNHKDLQNCLFACFLSQEEAKKVTHALKDPSWIEAMQEELLQFKLQEDERGIVIRNKARLVAQGYTQEEGINYDEVFSPVARIEAIRLFLACASFKDFVVYQMDVKSAFLYEKIEEEVIRKDGIFISQDKYMTEILKKFGFTDVKTTSTPMETQKLLLKDEDGEEVDVHLYRSMIGSLMYLTSSKPDIMFAVCACARYQVNPKVLHLHAVKRSFRYLKGQHKLGLWYPKDLPFDLVAYIDSDYAGASLDRKSTIGGCEFLGSRLISWQCKKQTVVANSTIEAEYVAASSCCG
ncbi:putative ribonuclease H-like domain-containing protein [Tanacetum coccineum]